MEDFCALHACDQQVYLILIYCLTTLFKSSFEYECYMFTVILYIFVNNVFLLLFTDVFIIFL